MFMVPGDSWKIYVVVLPDVSQHNALLNWYALAKVAYMVVIFEVSHPPISWLKTTASIKVFSKVVTEAVSHILMSWLNFDALTKVACIVVIFEVSHPPISWLKTFVS